MTFLFVLVGLMLGVFLVLILKGASKEKKVFALMQLQQKGEIVDTKKVNLEELNRLHNLVLKPLEQYINGADSSIRPRHDFSPRQFVKLSDDRMLFSAWVQDRYSSNRPQSSLYVVEYRDGSISRFVNADDFISSNGNIENISNVQLENTQPNTK